MGSQSSSGGTTRTEPPKYQLPYLQDSLQQAQGLYRSNNPVFAPQNGSTIDALQGIGDMARNGSPVTSAAGNLATQTLNGGFMGANPHLDAMYNRAAMASQGQLASQFGGAGRNVDQSQGNRAQQLNDLATSMYGGAYDAERNRQQQTLAMSPALGQAQYSDLDRLLGVGQTQEGYHQQSLDAPGTALDQYIGRISGNMGQTTINTGSRNVAGGALGGAMMGSALGPWGALGGGILGGIFG
jgi:hypothetical protein